MNARQKIFIGFVGIGMCLLAMRAGYDDVYVTVTNSTADTLKLDMYQSGYENDIQQFDSLIIEAGQETVKDIESDITSIVLKRVAGSNEHVIGFYKVPVGVNVRRIEVQNMQGVYTIKLNSQNNFIIYDYR